MLQSTTKRDTKYEKNYKYLCASNAILSQMSTSIMSRITIVFVSH